MKKDENFTFNAEYANQVMDYLPLHAYIDKTVCGVGMTSIALESPVNVLVLVPTKLLVINKSCQYPSNRCNYHIQGVTGDISDEELNFYINDYESVQPLKFICTYDSFFRVLPFAQRNDVQVVVDESDKIISMAPLKVTKNNQQDVMNYMLTELEKIKERVTFISSTPVPLKYFEGTTGAWLDTLDHIVYNWTSTITVVPIMCKRRSPVKALKKEIIEPILLKGQVEMDNKQFKKIIVFMNSVEAICQVITDCCISDLSGIICSYSAATDTKLNRFGFENRRIKNYSNLPPFTFITSTGFQGIDLDDSEAMNVIVTSGSSDVGNCWMLDLQLDVKQAVSRNRNKNNPNSDRFVFIYNQGVFEADPNDIMANINETEELIVKQLVEFNKIQIYDDEKFLPLIMQKYTYRDDNGELTLNSLVFNHDRYTTEEVVKMFHSGFRLMSNITNTFSKPVIIPKPKESKTTSYKVIYEKYNQSLNGATINWTKEELASESYKLIDQCYKQLGQIYRRSNYAVSLLIAKKDCDRVDIEKEVKKIIKPGKYFCKDLKNILQHIYDDCGFNRRAKAGDISNYYPDSSSPINGKSGKYINVK